MVNLDKPESYKKFDPQDVLGSVRLLADQIEEAWTEMKSHNTPKSCSTAKQVVICGMGGSALGGRIIDALAPDKTRTPIETFTEYNIPRYVNKDTLVILSSYSGNTEETVTCAHKALKANAQLFVIATGGKLAEFAKENNLSSFIFDPKNNPADQPRLALGYSIATILSLLSKCNFLTISDSDMEKAIKSTRQHIVHFGIDTPQNQNIAKKLAAEIKNKMPILMASEHLVGAAHAFKNQLNEGAKTFSVLFDLPELNHHLMEGLRNPAQAKQFFHFLIFESNLYSDRVKKRYPVTKKVLDKNEVQHSTIKLSSETKLEQVFELLAFGSFVQFYLAMLYELNPSPIPYVDFFKSELAK